MAKEFDWRSDYVICEHVAEDAGKATCHHKFRVCCSECNKREFLTTDIRTYDNENNFCIGEFFTDAQLRITKNDK